MYITCVDEGGVLSSEASLLDRPYRLSTSKYFIGCPPDRGLKIGDAQRCFPEHLPTS